MQESIFSLLPPLIAIIIAIWRRNALPALFFGLLLCHILLAQGDIIAGGLATLTGLGQVFTSINNIYIVCFSLLIGALVKLIQASGAVNGFINNLQSLNLVKNAKQASLLPTIIGTSVFTDTNLSMFTSGMASQQLFDKYHLSRARLAYLLDSTCAPVSILLLLNGWGAYLLGLLESIELSQPVTTLMATIGYNFYAIIALALAYYTAFSGKVYGPLKQAEIGSAMIPESSPSQLAPAKVMWLPLMTLLTLTLCFLWSTGQGDLRQGNGAFSVFWALICTLILLISLIFYYRLLTIKQIINCFIAGIKYLQLPVAILVLSFAFSSAINALGTGIYISQLLTLELPIFLLAPILFISAAIIAFTTGTSWGTWAILVPITLPIAIGSGLPIHFLLAAVLGGGIFGDHASPISDTTIVASIASGCDHFEHVSTQLPYALFGAGLSLVLYTLFGLSF